jgi:lipid-binding SYLF domain-containing protein
MRKVIFPLLLVIGGGIVGCDTSTPNSPAQQTAMRDEARAALERMEAQDPSLTNNVNNAVGYVIFPEVGNAAIGIGGSYGQGYVYQNGHRVGTVKMTEGSVGIQVGGDTYAELIIFNDQKPLNRLMNNSFEFASNAQAMGVKAGAAGAAQFTNGSQVYILGKGGLFAGAAVSGQKFKFLSDNGSSQETQTTTEANTTVTH